MTRRTLVAMRRMRDRIGEALFQRVAGPDGERHRERIHLTPGPRWFDPASPIGRVHGDAAMFIGGIRAILLDRAEQHRNHGAGKRATGDQAEECVGQAKGGIVGARFGAGAKGGVE